MKIETEKKSAKKTRTRRDTGSKDKKEEIMSGKRKTKEGILEEKRRKGRKLKRDRKKKTAGTCNQITQKEGKIETKK